MVKLGGKVVHLVEDEQTVPVAQLFGVDGRAVVGRHRKVEDLVLAVADQPDRQIGEGCRTTGASIPAWVPPACYRLSQPIAINLSSVLPAPVGSTTKALADLPSLEPLELVRVGRVGRGVLKVETAIPWRAVGRERTLEHGKQPGVAIRRCPPAVHPGVVAELTLPRIKRLSLPISFDFTCQTHTFD